MTPPIFVLESEEITDMGDFSGQAGPRCADMEEKKRSKRNCGMCGGVSVLSHVGEIYTKITKQRT